MIFNDHSSIVGRHAFLSASKHHWTNYDSEKLDRTFINSLALQRGIEHHEFAHNAIRLGIKLPRSRRTLNAYVNDAIGYRMTPEQVLYYSDNAFGTADAISFREEFLRIHDLKTGSKQSSMRQLEVYTAFFCLEYGYKPEEIAMELRIYQNDYVEVHVPEAEIIRSIMQKTVEFDVRVNTLKSELT